MNVLTNREIEDYHTEITAWDWLTALIYFNGEDTLFNNPATHSFAKIILVSSLMRRNWIGVGKLIITAVMCRDSSFVCDSSFYNDTSTWGQISRSQQHQESKKDRISTPNKR